MDKDGETFALCKTKLNDAAAALLKQAQAAGTIREDVMPRDLLLLGHGVAVATDTPETTARLLSVMLAGLRAETGTTPPG